MHELNDLTGKIIGAAYEVSNELGTGFLEKVYENALALELRQKGLLVKQQVPLKVFYKNEIVGEYYPDLIVEEQVIVELKVIKTFENIHMAQLLNYLKSCQKHCGLLINFGKSKTEIKRVLNGH